MGKLESFKKSFSCIIGISSILLAATGYLYVLSRWLPPLALNDDTQDADVKKELSFPSSLEELKSLADVLKEYKKDHKGYLVLLFCSAYIYKQTFAIPGSVFMNLLAGALFGVWIGFPLVCFLTGCGATCCFLISKVFGKTLLMEFVPDRILALQNKVKANSDELFFFLLFLRIFPMSPNWFLNMASPVLGVPIVQFFFSVLIGLMPYNFICCQTGCILSQLNSLDDLFTLNFLFKLAGIAVVVLLPSLVVKKLKYHMKSH